MNSATESIDLDPEIFIQQSNHNTSTTTDAALSTHELLFLGEGNAFTIGNIFQPGERVEVKLLHMFHPIDLSYESLYNSSKNSSSVKTQTLEPPTRYEIALCHGAYNWKICRTQAELRNFDRAIREAWLKIRVKQIKRRVIQNRPYQLHDHRPKIDGMKNEGEKIEEYLSSVINRIEIQCLNVVLEFFEISPLTFCARLGTSKFKEGEVQMLPKKRPLNLGMGDKLGKKRWIILKDSYLLVMKPHKVDQGKTEDGDVSFDSDSGEENGNKRRGRKLKSRGESKARDEGHFWYHYRRWRFCKVLLMDRCFDRKIMKIGGLEFLQVRNLHNQVTFTPSHFGSALDWAGAVNAAQLTNEARDYTAHNDHGSFAPMRTDSQILVGIDGAAYMAAVADAMEAARYEILIADWFLSPEIYLKRPYFSDRWRLDVLLKRKAEQGVRICILIYREVKLVLNINSRYTMKKLTSLHKNIHVIRHPSHIRDRTFNWSHHEKMVVVDQSVVFMGGIDLCFGRWDRPDHPLLDIATKSTSLEVNDSAYLSLSAALLPIQEVVPHWLKDEITYLTSCNRCIRSDCQPSHRRPEYRSGILPRFSWGLHNRDSYHTEADESVIFSDDGMLSQRCSSRAKRNESNELPRNHGDLAALSSNRTDQVTSQDQGQFLFPGKDYVNLIFKDLHEVDKPEQSYLDRNKVPRMPWHDVGVGVNGKVVSDFARHFIQRWNAHRKRKAKQERKRFSVSRIPPVLIPMEPANPNLANRLHMLGGGGSYCGSSNTAQTSLKTQALRSVSHWSLVSTRDAKANMITCGKDANASVITEHSIQDAYVEAIRNAESFIYIENQFFISFMQEEDSSPNVRNKITQTIYDRVVRAYKEKKQFRVYIIIPLLPAFEGNPGDKRTGINIRTILHFTQLSLFKGKTALLPQLRRVVGDVDNYVSVCGLRKYQQWPEGRFITEQIYIHDKIMIVDDRKLIIGSANINDRSLLGERDSELGLYVEEIPSPKSKIGEGVVANMRIRLMAEHLGVLSTDRSDALFWCPHLLLEPASDKFYLGVWRKTAYNNMEIFDKVFKCSPSNDIREYISSPPPTQGRQPLGAEFATMLRQVRGHLCEYPQEYLADEKLTAPSFTKERLVSEDIWI